MAHAKLPANRPGEKTVCRSELGPSPTSNSATSGSTSASPTPTPDALLYLQSKLADHFQDSVFSPKGLAEPTNFSQIPSGSQHDVEHRQPEESPEPETMPFRLFANQAQKIRIKSPPPAPGAFVHPRPLKDYFVSAPSPETRALLAASAVSYATIQAMARVKWTGCAMPWRVTRLVLGKKQARKLARMEPVLHTHVNFPRSRIPTQKAEASKLPEVYSVEPTEMMHDEPLPKHWRAPMNKGKTKPGKKRRLVLRERQRAAVAAEAAKAVAARQMAEEAEEAEARDRLKRAARNRAKRARKVKKAQAARDDKGQGAVAEAPSDGN